MELSEATFSDLVGEDLAANPALSKFAESKESVSSLAKSYLDIESKYGASQKELDNIKKTHVQIPAEDADDKVKAEFFNKIGCPKTADEYPDIEIDGLPPIGDDDTSKAIKEACIKSGITGSQYKSVMTELMKNQLISLDSFVKQDEQSEKAAVESLTKEWGGEKAFKEKTNLAKRLLEQYDKDSEISEFLIETRLGSYAPLVKLLGNIASDVLAESTSVTGGTDTSTETKSQRAPSGMPILSYDKSGPEFQK